MTRLLPLLLTLVLGAAAAVGLAACGSTDHLIPSSDASSLDRQLSAVREDVAGARCDSVDEALQKLDSTVANLPKSVNKELRDALRRGVTNLSARAPGACLNTNTVVETTPSVTTPVEPDPTPTEPTPEPEPTTPATTPEPDPTPTTPEPEPTPEPTPTPTPDDPTGGAVAP